MITSNATGGGEFTLDGTNSLRHPSRKPPVLGSILPAAAVQALDTCVSPDDDLCLNPCPVCGNGVTAYPEECDNNVGTPVNCDGCSSTCRVQTCDDGNPQTIDSCDPTLGCRFVLGPTFTPNLSAPTQTQTKGPDTPTPSRTATGTVTVTATITETPTATATPTPSLPMETPTVTATASRTATPAAGAICTGDCNGNGLVSALELFNVTCRSVTCGGHPMNPCSCGGPALASCANGDRSGNSQISALEIFQATQNSIDRSIRMECAAPTPTVTP
jgi:cysteine-rich repeat protein